MLNHNVVDGGGGATIKIYTHLDLVKVWNQLDTAQQASMAADMKEVDEAMAKVAEAWCDHADDFRKKITDFQADYNAVFATARGHLNGVFTEHSNVTENLLLTSQQWKDTAKAIGEVAKSLWEHHQEDKWISDAAKEYRAALPTQKKALQELQGIANTSSLGCDQIAMMNGYMYSGAYFGLSGISRKISEQPGALTVKGSADYVFVGETYYENYSFMNRTWQIKGWITAFNDWVTQQTDALTADWSTAAADWGTKLNDTLTMPNNLKPNGEWPVGQAGETPPAANTGEYDYFSAFVGGPDTDTNNGGYKY